MSLPESNGAHAFSQRTPALVLVIFGLVPAAIIATLLRFAEGQLVFIGQPLSPYDLSRLTAGLIGAMTPIYLLAPPALSASPGRRGAAFWPLVCAAPFLLFGPGVLAGLVVGGRGLAAPFLALAALGALAANLVLWLETARLRFSWRIALLAYGGLWACSGFLAYVSVYLAPNFEMPALKLAAYLNWFLPQIQSGPAAVEEYLHSGAFPWPAFWPVLAQIPPLALILINVKRKDKDPVHRVDPS